MDNKNKYFEFFTNFINKAIIVVLLLFISYFMGKDIISNKNQQNKLIKDKTNLEHIIELNKLIALIQKERGLSILYKSAKTNDIKAELDDIKGLINEKANSYDFEYKKKLKDLFFEARNINEINIDMIFINYTKILNFVSNDIKLSISEINDNDVHNELFYFLEIGKSQEYLGLLRAKIGEVISKDSLLEKNYLDIYHLNTSLDNLYQITNQNTKYLFNGENLSEILKEECYVNTINTIEKILSSKSLYFINDTPLKWFKSATCSIELLHVHNNSTLNELINKTSSNIKNLKEKLLHQILLYALFTIFLFALLLIFYILRRKLEERNRLLTSYQNAIDINSIVVKTTPKGIITFVNDKYCEISGYTKDELLGASNSIVKGEETTGDTYKDLWHTVRVLKKPWIGELKNKRKDGSPYWIKTIINPIFNNYGEIVEFLAIALDTTEHWLIKEFFTKQLNITSENLSKTINLAKEYEIAIKKSNIVSRLSLDYKYTYVNDKFCELVGYTQDELLDKDLSYLIKNDLVCNTFSEIKNSLEKGNIWQGVVQNISKNGVPYWVNTTAIPIKCDNNIVIEYMFICHNLTELYNLHNEIEETQREVIYKMGEIGETRSKETGNHVKRVAEYSKLLALKAGLSLSEAEILKYASPMHDIGKVAIPDSILNKAGKLTTEEYEYMKNHSQIGYDLLKTSTRPILKAAAIVSYEHHEKWDGSGYPRALKGENIHIYGRITAICDVFDALAHERIYKKAWELDRILEFFNEQKGKHFDPRLIDLFIENLNEFLKIKEQYL